MQSSGAHSPVAQGNGAQLKVTSFKEDVTFCIAAVPADNGLPAKKIRGLHV
jgi:hypothetical protein